MILLVAALAAAAPILPAFAPPIGRDALYETEQVRRTPAGEQHYRMVNRLAFARAAGGWQLTLTLVDISTDAPADAAALFDAGMRPFLDTAIVMRLDPDGRPVAALNADAAWGAITASLARVEREFSARNGGDSVATRATAAWFAAFAGLKGPERDAKLLETADALIGFDLPALRPGESGPWRTAGAEGETAAGTVTLETATGPALAYRVASRTALPGQTATLDEDSRFRIDRATGLLVESVTVKSLGGQTLAEERIRRLR